MKEKVKIGIIGTGQIGKAHIRRYQDISGAEIAAVCDINEAEARRVAEEYGIPHVCQDYRGLLERGEIEAADVCLHNNLHRPVTVAALEAGKHVFCEKPIAGSYADGAAMAEKARETGRMLCVQLHSAFSNETKAARRLIENGCLGRVYHARSTGYRRRGRPFVDGYGTKEFVKKSVAAGGALYDMGVYHISQILYLLGNPAPARISGKVYQECAMDEARRRESGFDVEEMGCGFIKFGDGLTLDIIETWAAHMNAFEGSCIMGREGGVRLSPFGFYSRLCDMDMDAAFDLGKAHFRWQTVEGEGDAYDSPQCHWVAALQGRVPLEPIAETTLNTMLVSEGICLSSRLGREVTAQEVMENSAPASPPI